MNAKIFLFSLFLFGIVNIQSVTETHKSFIQTFPFGIEIGTTHYDDVVKRGTCRSKKAIRDNTICRSFDFTDDGSFNVRLDDKNIVYAVEFDIEDGNTFPKAWERKRFIFW